MPDWAALKKRYASEALSYRQLAGESGVPYAALARRGAREGWAAARKARATCDKLEVLKQSADLAAARVSDLLRDEQQFHRHLVRYGRDGEFGVEELVLQKVDTKALRDVVSTIKDMAKIMRDLHDLLSEQEKARLELARLRAGAGGDDLPDVGVIQLPMREDAP